MRKRIIIQDTHGAMLPDLDWLDLETLAQAELTSEDAAYPIESALKPGERSGWRASASGRQTIRLMFDNPLAVKRIHLAFYEEEQARTQEFLLRWSSDDGRTYKEIVRQQYTFSPPDNIREIEEYEVDLAVVTRLEITITPDISDGSAHASLAELRLA